MQEKNSPEQSLALHDAEMTFGEADKQMRTLMQDFQHQGYRRFTYDYIDGNDVHQWVAFIPESGTDQNRAVYQVDALGIRYKLAVTRSSELNGGMHTDSEVECYDTTLKDYVPASSHEQLQLASALHHLNYDEIAADIKDVLAKEKAEKFSWWGKVAHRKHQ
jgi:hypothetical protein